MMSLCQRSIIGERKIDIAVYPDASEPFPQIAIQTGVLIP